MTGTATVFVLDDPDCKYDIIVGRDFLIPHKMTLDFGRLCVEWYDRTILMKPANAIRSMFLDQFLADDDLEPLNTEHDDPEHEHFMNRKQPQQIKAAKYEGIEDLDTVVKGQKHLDDNGRTLFRKCLDGITSLFSATLGKYPHKQIHLELKDGEQPHHARPYPVPVLQKKVFIDEADHLCKQDVLEKWGISEHAYPTFIVPKKDGRVRWVSDFRKLNLKLKRKIYGLPRIYDIIQRRRKYSYMTKLDLSMMFYTFELDEASRNLCVITTPFGNYRYKRLPMGVHNSPDHAQEIMEGIFLDLQDRGVEVFIDDIGIFTSSTLDDHFQLVREVLLRLEKNGFRCNPLKCEWAVQETDWLGYWFTPEGVKPWKKKVEGILKVEKPKNVSQLRSFIGALNFYRDMWPRRSHRLAPLSKLLGKSIFEWTPECDEAFRDLKKMIADDTLLHFPDHTKPFHVYTDASDFQLGAVIMQDGKPLAYYSRKLNSAQKNYTVTEKELLSIVETLKEFRCLLFGAEIHVHTDHRNLTYANLTTQRVIRWRLFLEEFAPKFHFIAGKENVLADFLSRSPLVEKTPEDDPEFTMKMLDFTRHLTECHLAEEPQAYPIDDKMNELFPTLLENTHAHDCFLNVPAGPNPTTPQYLRPRQQNQAELLQKLPTEPQKYQYRTYQDTQLICYRKDAHTDFRIVIPDAILDSFIQWQHLALAHAGIERTHHTISRTHYHPRLHDRIRHLIGHCAECKKNKLPGVGYGDLAPRDAALMPWETVAIDCIGSWTIKWPNGINATLRALTMIDPVTAFIEIARIERPTAMETANAFERTWLTRYPKPTFVVHDNGSEFIGHDFQFRLDQWGTRSRRTTARNPQGNSHAERSHQTIADALRTAIYSRPNPADPAEAQRIIDTSIDEAVYALRTAVHSTLGVSPGAAVFHRDMMHDVPYVPNFPALRQKRQQKVDEALRRENAKRRRHDYRVGDQVYELISVSNSISARMTPRTRGPYTVLQVFTNGTVKIRRNNGVEERVNIRHLRPIR